MKVKFLMIAEIEVSKTGGSDEAHDKLDAFRESVLPSMNYGITLCRAKGLEDVSADLAREGVEVGGN